MPLQPLPVWSTANHRQHVVRILDEQTEPLRGELSQEQTALAGHIVKRGQHDEGRRQS